MHDPLQIREQFYLDPSITFLNFGSFGACPKPVMNRFHELHLEMEQEPVQFMTKKSIGYFAQARKVLSGYVGCSMDDIVPVTNPSWAVNAVARSLNLQPGDEIRTTSIEYGACDKAWQYYCKLTGAHYVQIEPQWPVTDSAQFVADFFTNISPRTKLIFMSHITSSTAIRLPVEQIIREAQRRGIPTFIDGAHAPGQIDLNLDEMGVDYYTGACHKWMMTPKGCSFLYAHPRVQKQIDPLIISWGYDAAFPSHSQFLDYHQVQGTRDLAPFFCLDASLQFMEENNWKEVASQCRSLVLESAPKFIELLGVQSHVAIHPDFLAQMFSIPVCAPKAEELQQELFDRYHIEIPVMRLGDKQFIRFSINGFNSNHDLDTLYQALRELKQKAEFL